MAETFEVAELAEDLDGDVGTEAKEPRLKYRQLENDIRNLTSTDTITCLTPHPKFLAIGTELGRVHVLDHLGFSTENGLHSVHTCPVNQISVSDAGDFMASCGDDGRIAIYNLSDVSANKVFCLDHPVKSIAIAPDYSQSQVVVFGQSKLLLLTRGVFSRNKQGELAKAQGLVRTIKWRGDFIIWADDARVCVYDARDQQHIAYVQFNEEMSSLYTRSIPCHLSWCTDTCFLIGRGGSLRVCQILERYSTTERRSSSRNSISRSSSIHIPTGASADALVGVASRYVELFYRIDLADSLVCGVSRHQTQLLALVVPSISTLVHSIEIPLELQVIDVDVGLSTAEAMRGYQIHPEQHAFTTRRGARGYCDLYLETVPGENTHYIVTSKEIVCAEELTVDDRIDWLIGQGHFLQALQFAKEHSRQLSHHTTQSVGMIYVNHLLETGQFELAAGTCAEFFSDSRLWEEYTYKFMRLGQLACLVPFLPTGQGVGSIQLDSKLYEAVLIYFMDRDPNILLSLLTCWCKRNLLESYDSLLRTLVDRIERHVSLSGISEVTVLEPGLRNLWQALAVLYEKVGSSEKALDILVQLHDPRVFELFERKPAQLTDWRLIEVLKERVEYFMELNVQRAVIILLDHISTISVDHVVTQLEAKPELLYQYLDSVYHRYPKLVHPYITVLIRLCTRFGRDKLLPLLRSTDSYQLSDALTICEQAKLVPETVYLLTRVGRRHDALQLIMTQGGEFSSGPNGESTISLEERQSVAAAAAIAYCCEEDTARSDFGKVRGAPFTKFIYGVPLDDPDPNETEGDENAGELWQQVVLFAVDKPAFICALLQHAGSEGLDPRLLLRKISPDMSIPGLKGSLITLLRNYKLQLELQQDCQRILRSDVHKLFSRLLESQARGVRVDSNNMSSVQCNLCCHPVRRISQPQSSVQMRNEPHIANDTEARKQPCVIFRCSHVCHKSCLKPADGAINCPVCAHS
ncbi:hypothetical protein EG68_09677 [Paragonimus skrjabini miyazakii]|uniref:Vps41 beta-propeller domain-containing protein n=1 Tax=Paragonimus skrjabini miyazakii TaxID=59628 RepID=A0A8S9YGJ3_9TREM|nr:hypothetical protein EG68_09677 [Paragonimus skrjabini miyazakii]